MTIIIKRNPNGDTRTADKNVSYEDFHNANISHIGDVFTVMKYLAALLLAKAHTHDNTKIFYEEDFYKDFKNTLQTGADFTKGKWYQLHITEEKHHPTSKLHEDYNLLDLLETICDCVCAGLARSGEVRPMEFDDKIVKLAIQNTIKLLVDNIEIEEEQSK